MAKFFILFFTHFLILGAGVLVGRKWRLISRSFNKFRPRKADMLKSPDALFKNLQEYFAREKPYLDPQLDIALVAQKLLTNRTYLARAIKENGMINFNYYVNSFRIREAIDIFRMDPFARVGETAVRTGFNSASAFTMAFKMYVNMTPKQWKDYYIFTSVSRLDKPAKRSASRRKDMSGQIVSDR